MRIQFFKHVCGYFFNTAAGVQVQRFCHAHHAWRACPEAPQPASDVAVVAEDGGAVGKEGAERGEIGELRLNVGKLQRELSETQKMRDGYTLNSSGVPRS